MRWSTFRLEGRPLHALAVTMMSILRHAEPFLPKRYVTPNRSVGLTYRHTINGLTLPVP